MIFSTVENALVTIPDCQAHLAAKYCRGIASPFAEQAKDNFVKVGVIGYIAENQMMVLLGTTCAELRRKVEVIALLNVQKREQVCCKMSQFVREFPGSVVTMCN